MKVNNLFVIIIFFLFAGCAKSTSSNEPKHDLIEPKYDSTINGRFLTCSSNQRFSLELDLNADSGYQWDYSISDTNIVRIDSTSYRPKSGNWNQVGGVTIETFYFHTMRYGKSDIEMIEHQAWMPNVPPIDTIRFIVSVPIEL